MAEWISVKDRLLIYATGTCADGDEGVQAGT